MPDTLVRHRLVSPTDGIVAVINHNRGEFVENGAAVLRIVPLGRLRCEGFVEASHVDATMYGRPVKITVRVSPSKSVTLDGSLTFVSPLVDSIKGDVHVAAEFNNPKMAIRPGMKADMQILPADVATRTEPESKTEEAKTESP